MIKKIFLWFASLHGEKTFECVVHEWHSFLIGWAEGITLFRKPLVKINTYALTEMKTEWHYYNIGRAVGFISFIILTVGMIVWIRS